MYVQLVPMMLDLAQCPLLTPTSARRINRNDFNRRRDPLPRVSSFLQYFNAISQIDVRVS
jgi:hypothetical protein